MCLGDTCLATLQTPRQQEGTGEDGHIHLADRTVMSV